MAKIRIYDLSKEINVSNKDIVAHFAASGKTFTASSGLTEQEADEVRRAFGEKAAPAGPDNKEKKEHSAVEVKSVEEKKRDVRKDESTNRHKSEQGGASRQNKAAVAPVQKRKRNITAVFHSENSKEHGSSGRKDGKGQGRNRKPSTPERRGPIKPRTDGNRVRPKGLDAYPDQKFESKPTKPVPAASQAANKPVSKPKTEEMPKKKEEAKPEGPVKLGNIMEALVQQKKRNAERKKEAAAERRERRNGSASDKRSGRGDRDNDRRRNSFDPGIKDRGNNGPGEMASADKGRHNGKPHNKRGRADHDALGRKEEHYINLEKNGGKKKTKNNNNNKVEKRDPDEIITITVPDRISLRDLADKMKVVPSEIIKKLFLAGKVYTLNSEVDFDEAENIAAEFNCILEHEEKVDVIAELVKDDEDDPSTLVPRPPVVCVMGHVDHGKTSLLDKIRHTHVSDKEAGGITQKIGAYVVSIDGKKITFLDTPGHEAFTAMRMRGANSTDIAILVVAADDGVMPQTVEAINHAKAAGVEIIVAVNKIDKPNANVERVKQELSEYELIPEDWGGSTIFVPVSAHTGEGIDQLLEMVLLTADVMELKANPKRNARGLVIEAELDKGRGVVATVLVQKGTLHVGDPVAAGSSFGKVRAMLDENGKRVKKAGPSTPVEILGLSEVPNAGEILNGFDTEKESRDYASTFVSVGKENLIEETRRGVSLDDLFSQIKAGNVKELDIIVKADVQGSVEAVRSSLEKLSNDEVVVKVIHGGVGAITESDVNLAAASNAIIIGFNVKPDNVAKSIADHEGVDVRLYKVIYNAIADVESAMKGMLEPVYEEQVIGHATVRATFKSSEAGIIAGCIVDDGYMERDSTVRIRRGDEQIYEGKLISLKRFKDDAKTVKAGYECGLVVEGFSDYQEDDSLEAYKMVEVARK
ncbi:MAG: translation initiation factor IF-2 [Lachnospiraceae bacterium]|nr:translation initiation factor IF-2 [Lachnospiraceae bacterium]